MGHGRKKDQASHHRRHKSFSNSGSADKKPADDPFYELQVVDEHLVWITWEELSVVTAITVVLLIFYISWSYKDLEATLSSFSSFSDRERYTRRETKVAEFPEKPETQQTPTIPGQSIFGKHGSSEAQECSVHPFERSKPQRGDECYCQEPVAATTPPSIMFDDYTELRPHLCPDGKNYGYETYAELEELMAEINKYSHDRYVEWDVFYEKAVDFDGTFENAASKEIPNNIPCFLERINNSYSPVWLLS